MLDFYSPTDLDKAARWGANCGPAAIAAAFGLEIAGVRKAVSRKGKFSGHMSIPDVMLACENLGRRCTRTATDPGPVYEWPRESTHIGMVQIDGPWRANNFQAAKRRHLVAVRWRRFALPGLWMIYDVNAGEWVPAIAWEKWVMDPLARNQDVFPDGSGSWFFSWRGTLEDAQ